MSATGTNESPLPSLDRRPPRALVVSWLIFWALMFTLSFLEHAPRPDVIWWQPLLWEGTSFLAASGIVLLAWVAVPRLDPLLSRPWRWLRWPLLALPLIAPAFVAVIYGLRHAVYGLSGLVYQHDPWPVVLAFESAKFAMFYGLFAVAVFGLRSHAALAAERIALARERELVREAQLHQLTQQLEPHFLFNALNTIAATVHEDPALADRLIVRLAQLLRAATDSARQPQQSLAEEIGLLEAQADILRQRFGARLTIDFQVDPDTLGCQVPTLILQPLLENACRHGVEQRPGLVRIVIGAERQRSRLRLTVEDDAGRLDETVSPGVGLGNVARRLAITYGSNGRFDLSRIDDRAVRATVELPCAS